MLAGCNLSFLINFYVAQLYFDHFAQSALLKTNRSTHIKLRVVFVVMTTMTVLYMSKLRSTVDLVGHNVQVLRN